MRATDVLLLCLTVAGCLHAEWHLVEVGDSGASRSNHPINSVEKALRVKGAAEIRTTGTPGWLLVRHASAMKLSDVPGVKRVFRQVASPSTELPKTATIQTRVGSSQYLIEVKGATGASAIAEVNRNLKTAGVTAITPTAQPGWILVEHPSGEGLDAVPEVARVFRRHSK